MSQINKKKEFILDAQNYLLNHLSVDLVADYRFYTRINKVEDNYDLKVVKDFIESHKIINKDHINWFIWLAEEHYGVFIEYNEVIEYLVGLRTFGNNYSRIRFSFRGRVNTPFRERAKYNKNKSQNKKKTPKQKAKEQWRKDKFKKRDKQKSWKRKWKYWSTKHGHKSMRQEVRKKLQKGNFDDIDDYDLHINPWSWE